MLQLSLSNRVLLHSAATLLLFLTFFESTTAFEKKDIYSVDTSNWVHKVLPDGDVFICSICKSELRLQITFGREFGLDRDANAFRTMLSNPALSKKLADNILRMQIPLPDTQISIEKSQYADYFGLKMLQFNAKVKIGDMVTHDNSFVGVHRNKVVKVTLNYFSGALDATAKNAVGKFYSSLIFVSQ